MLTAAIAVAVVVIVGFWIAGRMFVRFGGLVVAIFGVLALAIDPGRAGSRARRRPSLMARRALASRHVYGR